MGYYIRLLTPSLARAPLTALRAALEAEGRADIALATEDAEEDEDVWTGVLAYTEAGEPICFVTRDVVGEGDLAAGELEDFAEELAEALPKSGAAWVRAYLKTVKVIYAAQYMAGAFTEAGDGGPSLLIGALQDLLGGVVQCDGEGFSNEDGAMVVWQFDETAEGAWRAALWDDQAKTWRTFEVDLANPAHREAFQAGRPPNGVETG